MANKILLIEDDVDFGFMLKQYLEFSGFEIELLADPREVQKDLDILHQFDLAILDVMMPYVSGFSLAQEINQVHPDLPLIFLTAKDQKIDKLTGLKIGADDYLTKPCDPEELILRIQNIIRRSNPQKNIATLINIGEYQFDHRNLLLLHSTGSQQLTEMEAKLLNYLFENKNRIISREEILDALWSTNDFFTGRSMDVFISRLRKILQKDSNICIQSIRSIGYKVSF